jgi:hypothetical protein
LLLLEASFSAVPRASFGCRSESGCYVACCRCLAAGEVAQRVGGSYMTDCCAADLGCTLFLPAEAALPTHCCFYVATRDKMRAKYRIDEVQPLNGHRLCPAIRVACQQRSLIVCHCSLQRNTTLELKYYRVTCSSSSPFEFLLPPYLRAAWPVVPRGHDADELLLALPPLPGAERCVHGTSK